MEIIRDLEKIISNINLIIMDFVKSITALDESTRLSDKNPRTIGWVLPTKVAIKIVIA